MITKELVTIEFRYHDAPKGDFDCGYRSKTITVGIFDTLEEAIKEGNKALSILSKDFEVRYEDKFTLKHLFGSPKRLVTNTCYSTMGIQYFANIKKLTFDSLDKTIPELFKASNRYKAFKI